MFKVNIFQHTTTDDTKTLTKTIHWVHSHPDFVPANDKGDLAAPGVDEAGPAGVDGDVLAISRTETG